MKKSNNGSQPPSWKDVAMNLQQNLMYRFGVNEWDLYNSSKSEYLSRTVGYALFGPSRNLSSSNDRSGYDEKQVENINSVCDAIMREDVHGEDTSDGTWMSIVFVCTEIPVDKEIGLLISTVPVFRVPRKRVGQPDTVRYIDSNARVYLNWNDFLSNNLLPKCNICYPREGVYKADINGRVLVEFGHTPAFGVAQSVLTALDKSSSVLAMGSSAITIASLFLPLPEQLMNVTAMASGIIGIYGAMRSAATLIDRARHGQSITLNNQESINCWLSLGGSAVGTASTITVNSLQKMARNRLAISLMRQITVNTLSLGSIAIGALGVMNSGYVLCGKYKENSLTHLDIYQFTSSAIIFAHSAINIKTASTIMTETESTLQKHQDIPRKHKHKKFSKLKEMWSGDTIQGKTGFMSKMKMCKRKQKFTDKFPDKAVELWKSERKIQFTESGHVEINQKLIIDTAKLSEISNGQRKVFIAASKKLMEGNLSQGQFKEIMRSVNLEETMPYKYKDALAMPRSWRGKSIKAHKHHLDDNLKRIHDKDSYLSSNLESKDIFETQSNVTFSELGHVEINQKLIIDPTEYFKINNVERKSFFKASNDLIEGKMSQKHFKKIIKSLHNEEHSSRKVHKTESAIIPTEKKSHETGSRQKSMLAIVTLYGPANIYAIMKNFDKSLHQRLFEVAVKVSELMECSPARTFLDVLGSVCSYVQDLASHMERKYLEDLEAAKAKAGENFNQKLFDMNYKIKGKRFSHFCSVVVESFTADPSFIDRLVSGVEEGMDLYDDLMGSSGAESLEINSSDSESDASDSNENLANQSIRYRRNFQRSVVYPPSMIDEASDDFCFHAA